MSIQCVLLKMISQMRLLQSFFIQHVFRLLLNLYICNVWDLCPFIEKITLNREIVKLEYEKFSDFVIKFISNNYFIYANFEQSKIRKEKYTHKAYITGFNVNSNEIYLSDNVDFGRFTNFSLSFEDINNAFIKADDIIPLYDKDHQMEENSIYLIKVKEFNYKFNINLFIQFLKNYLNSESGMGFISNICNTPYRKDKFYYGVVIYNFINDYLNRLLNNVTKSLDNRIFTFLLDYENLMLKKINYLIKNNYLRDFNFILKQINENIKISEVMLYLFLKFGISNDKKELMKIQNYLSFLNNKDINLIENLLNNISGGED